MPPLWSHLGPLTAALLTGFSTLCVAQSEVCTELKALTDAAPSGLQNLMGKVIPADAHDAEGEEGCCYATRNLPSANFCTLKPSQFWERANVYTCQWLFMSAQEASRFAKPFQDSVKTCLPTDVWADESDSSGAQYRASLNGGRHL